MKTGENRARPDEGNTRNEERRRAMQRTNEWGKERSGSRNYESAREMRRD